jgi:hypothetical protein
MATIDQVVEKYVEIRDKQAELRKAQTAEMAKYNDALLKLEAWLMNSLNESGAESVRTVSGTVYKSIRTSAKVADWDALLEFITDNGAWNFLERRVSKTAVEEYMEGEGGTPPGVSVVREATIGVRRS